jgi:hypothetical protein
VDLRGGLMDYDNFNDPAITAALEQAYGTASPDQWAALVARAEKLTARQLPWIPTAPPDTLLLGRAGASIYIAFGGTGDYRHVWHFDGSQWQQRSGPAAGSLDSFLDVQANAIAADPAQPAHLYVGADIGVWQSIDGGATWASFSEGLPDATC